MKKNTEWGFLREDSIAADKAGFSSYNNLHRTGLEKYLSVIFPDVNDWVHDKIIGNGSRKRPDYRSEVLKLIVEFDGIQHYNNPLRILQDEENTKFYESLGYKVVRIPYFIQLTNDVVETLFGVKVEQTLFDNSIPSLSPDSKNTPAFLCKMGIKRMAYEYKKFPNQYKVNIDYLKTCQNQSLVDYKDLEDEYNKTI